ncbi:MAG: hypothetical protein ACXQS8_02445 [Candidatus Helarchaeales archaeon]
MGRKNLEDEIHRAIQGSSTRILGPNCIGVFCPEGKICFFPDQLPDKEGNVVMFSQSGGILRTFIWTGLSHGFFLRAGISFGNQLDISVQELLDFFGQDEKTSIIAIYLEGVKDGKEFMKSLKRAAAKKYVIIFKAGTTEGGKKTVSSHTGALSGSEVIFKAVVRQAGGIVVDSFEELCDTVSMLSVTGNNGVPGRNVAIVNTGGGFSVELADIAEKYGLIIPEFSVETQKKLQAVLPDVNTIVINPLDLGASGFNPDVTGKVFTILFEDDRTDTIISVREVERFGYLGKQLNIPDMGQRYLEEMLKNQNPSKKIIMIIPKSWETPETFHYYQSFQQKLLENGIACYPTPERAVKALVKVLELVENRSNEKKSATKY